MTSAGELGADRVRGMFAEVMAEMDARPRPLSMRAESAFEVGLERGEPVFRSGGAEARARFRGRWIAEHPVPASVRPGDVLRFAPASGNRVKVRIRRAAAIVRAIKTERTD